MAFFPYHPDYSYLGLSIIEYLKRIKLISSIMISLKELVRELLLLMF